MLSHYSSLNYSASHGMNDKICPVRYHDFWLRLFRAPHKCLQFYISFMSWALSRCRIVSMEVTKNYFRSFTEISKEKGLAF